MTDAVAPQQGPAGPEHAVPVAILAPTGSDGIVARRVLERAGFETILAPSLAALCDLVDAGVGAMMIAEEALGGPALRALVATLDAQPSWSDLPVLVLTGEGELSRPLSGSLATITARANVTLLERPVRIATLVTALHSALRARRRQFDVRDYIVERAGAEAERERLLALAESERAEADAANRAKSEFLAVMSHELRTPLNAIGGYTELLDLGLRGPITAEQRLDLQRIRRSQEHLLGLINDVLNFARLEAGRAEYEITDVSIPEVITEVLGLVLPQVNAKGLVLDSSACEAALTARADREKLRQVLVNLVSNAVKFTDAPGRIVVLCQPLDELIRVQVRDSGIGIPSDRLEHIFDPFVQVDPKLTRRREGTGLGLAISRDLARGMQGDLQVESVVGRGTTFTLTLPRGQDTAEGRVHDVRSDSSSPAA